MVAAVVYLVHRRSTVADLVSGYISYEVLELYFLVTAAQAIQRDISTTVYGGTSLPEYDAIVEYFHSTVPVPETEYEDNSAMRRGY